MSAPLELDQDMSLQRRMWLVQRVGWIIGGLFLIAALAGALGEGVISHKKEQAGNATLEYERVARRETPTPVRIEGKPADETFEVEVDRKIADAIDAWIPDPRETVVGPETVTARFDAFAAGAGVTMRLKHPHAGSTNAGVRVGPNRFEFKQFVLP
ncbi:MAG TPA: hypothetical protein VD971_02535 [Phycisphaerales bacterium]|nr:hypothetical protein [Phycisphaerales bacterium]